MAGSILKLMITANVAISNTKLLKLLAHEKKVCNAMQQSKGYWCL